ncbi:MAG: retroviral-like aspartic protease family protein [Oscillospiraceae bacterium]|nr:retroviral-like aspartic protease family protein [Oscillospiraceae bacterium]
MEQIEVKLKNDIMYAEIPFWSVIDGGYLDMVVMIDTGATTTAFASNALKRIGCYSEAKKGKARTAGGFVDTYEVQIPKIKIGNMELAEVGVSSHEQLNDFPFDGILGMNVLMQFNFNVDFDENMITLKRRLGKRSSLNING